MAKTPSTTLVTKEEALRMLAKHIRKPNVTANELLKLIGLQSKIAGWDKSDAPTDEGNLDRLVTEIEKRRKSAQ
jgi:hypothetical protein